MKTKFKVKPPKIGTKLSLNGYKCVILDVRPMVGYSPRRWMVELETVRKKK